MQSFMQAKTYILYNNILSMGMGDNGNEYCVTRCNGKTFKREIRSPSVNKVELQTRKFASFKVERLASIKTCE